MILQHCQGYDFHIILKLQNQNIGEMEEKNIQVQNAQYIKLGCLSFGMTQEQAIRVSQFIQDYKLGGKGLSEFKNRVNPDNLLLACRISQQTLEENWENFFAGHRSHFIQIFQSDNPQMEFKEMAMENINQKFRLNLEAKGLFSHLFTIQKHGIAQLYQPFIFKSQNEFGQVSKIGMEVWIRQQFLEQQSKIGQQFLQSIENSQFQSHQSEKITEKKNTVYGFPGEMIERSAIYVMRLLLPKHILMNNQIKKQTQMRIPLPLNFQQLNRQSNPSLLSPYLSIQPKVQIKQSLVSLNFTSGDQSDAGLYFDLGPGTLKSSNPPGFAGDLKNYQKEALTWMLYRQGIGGNGFMDMRHIPYWEDIGKKLQLQQKIFVNLDLCLISWKKNVEKKCNGGILADDMGLGKTVMIIALMLSNRPNNSQTLIITPLSLLKQWKEKIEQFAPSLRVSTVYNKQINEKCLKGFDVVITTEGKIRHENLRDQLRDKFLMRNQWFRIVVDEAHSFKNSTTAMSKAICLLNSQYRWCLTGTPTQNSIGDLFSLVKFLRYTPWCWSQKWDSTFPKDVKSTEKRHIIQLKQILKGVMLRRKKESIDEEGKRIIEIPKVDVKVQTVHLSQEAKKLYRFYDFKAKKAFSLLEQLQKMKSSRYYLNNKRLLFEMKRAQYCRVMSLLMKMRMISCHQLLQDYRTNYVLPQNFICQYLKFLGKKGIKRRQKYNFFDQYFAEDQKQRQYIQKQKRANQLRQVYSDWDEVMTMIQSGKRFNCLKCLEPQQEVITPCLHTFCKPCLQDHFHKKILQFTEKNQMGIFEGDCPYCGQELKTKEVFDLPVPNQFNLSIEKFKPNEKIRQLMKHLLMMEPDEKALIFTCFLGMMTLIGITLQQNQIGFLTIQGSDKIEERNQKIAQFNRSSQVRVLILTLKTGSVGLNLQRANLVFFMDPWWNPAIQQQAIGRVHRFGQNKQVRAIKFITQQTVEARILKLSLLKKEMSDSLLDIDDVQTSKRYSKTREQLKFLLSMQENITEEERSEKMEINEQIQLGLNQQQFNLNFSERVVNLSNLKDNSEQGMKDNP